MNVEVFLIGLGLSLLGIAYFTFAFRVVTGRTRLKRLPWKPHRIPLGLAAGPSGFFAGIGMSSFAVGGQEGTDVTTTVGMIALGLAGVLFLVGWIWLLVAIFLGDRILPDPLLQQLKDEGRYDEPLLKRNRR